MRGNSTSKAAGIALSVSLTVAGVAAATSSEAGEAQTDGAARVASSVQLDTRAVLADRASRSVKRGGASASAKAPRRLSAKQRVKLRGKRLVARDRAALRADRSVKRSTARKMGRHLADVRGWDGRQWRCLDRLWRAESGWRPRAANGSSGAYGIPQALPGHKMSSHGRHWRLSAHTQIRWGLTYIDNRWSTPCGAYGHFLRNHWY